MTRYKYTLGFIHCSETNEILLLNRQKAPWMGRWNGVGGKLDDTETPLECIMRETKEETGLEIDSYKPRGVLKWYRDDIDLGGVYLFTADVSKDLVDSYKTPKAYCHEGILDWKNKDWILHEENSGIVDNIKLMMENLLKAQQNDLFEAFYDGQSLRKVNYCPGKLE